ncbi:nucleotidyltransferase [Actinomadura bangladeshensis]|uniref:Nucleotidyltransferase family protein n=1 Tax=Actinomadura bangladeshensis TaxID=453573 RepID=A0A6L9Q8G2_9ACTN|nr:nucleotidyltransferase [Actinomadura bangladeshensis]NEA21739.1 nucleotidyltransferase family protein [Actinomadura bangladeshensis]
MAATRGSGTAGPGPGSGGVAEGLLNALKRAAAALRDAGIGYALAGGFAAYAHGAAVSTHDVDFVVRERDVQAALDALLSAGMTHLESPENWLEKAYDGEHVIDLIHTPSGRPVDGELLGRAEEMAVGAVLMPVLPATDLVVMRLLAFTETACDFSGFLHVGRALREQVDWRRVAAETARSPYAYAFLTLLVRLDVIEACALDGIP